MWKIQGIYRGCIYGNFPPNPLLGAHRHFDPAGKTGTAFRSARPGFGSSKSHSKGWQAPHCGPASNDQQPPSCGRPESRSVSGVRGSVSSGFINGRVPNHVIKRTGWAVDVCENFSGTRSALRRRLSQPLVEICEYYFY